MMSTRCRPANVSTRCCRCNSTGKCLRCSCARSGTPCSRCLPGESSNCRNTLPRDAPPSAQLNLLSNASSPVTTSSANSSRVPNPAPLLDSVSASGMPAASASANRDSSPSSASPPDLSSILQSHIPTLQHVPKGVRDLWAHTLSVCLSSAVGSPDDLSLWSQLFMLAKMCVG